MGKNVCKGETRKKGGQKMSVHLLKRRDLFEDLGIGGKIKLE
jgi:hypothetical protein